MAKFNKKQFERDYNLAWAGDDVMQVIQLMTDADASWKRRNLMRAHFELVFAYAHRENEKIDFYVKHASWSKPCGIAARIIERRKNEELAGGSSSQSAGVPAGDAVSTPSPPPLSPDGAPR
jgi:hypothetical protein